MSIKGSFFQTILLNYLFCFGSTSGKKLTDIPFIKNINDLPDWLNDVPFEISKSIIHFIPQQDFDFLNGFCKNNANTNILVCPSQLTGPDGLIFFKSNDDNFILILIGIKYSSNKIGNTIHIKNEHSTNVKNFFLRDSDTQMHIYHEFNQTILQPLCSKVKILYLLMEYSEINRVKVANEFLSDHQNSENQFTIQVTTNDIINTFKCSGLRQFEIFGKTLEGYLNSRAARSRTAKKTERRTDLAKKRKLDYNK